MHGSNCPMEGAYFLIWTFYLTLIFYGTFYPHSKVWLFIPWICLGYDRNRIFRPDTGMEAKSGSGIAGKGMLFQNSGSGKAGKGMLF